MFQCSIHLNLFIHDKSKYTFLGNNEISLTLYGKHLYKELTWLSKIPKLYSMYFFVLMSTYIFAFYEIELQILQIFFLRCFLSLLRTYAQSQQKGSTFSKVSSDCLFFLNLLVLTMQSRLSTWKHATVKVRSLFTTHELKIFSFLVAFFEEDCYKL